MNSVETTIFTALGYGSAECRCALAQDGAYAGMGVVAAGGVTYSRYGRVGVHKKPTEVVVTKDTTYMFIGVEDR
jgi:hypothetical protein